MSVFSSPWWLLQGAAGGHLQTLWPLLLKRGQAMPAYRRERVATPDHDFIDLDCVDAPANAPTIVLFHGLEGSSNSHYARALMQAVVRQKWRGVVVHFRGCSGEPNRLARAYHSGDSAEVAWVLALIKAKHPPPVYACGVSLGGNALLKHLGEQGVAAQGNVDAAVAVSVPYDLAAADQCLSQGFGRIYARHFLRTLIPRALAKAARFPDAVGLYDVAKISAASTLREFDDAVTAPLHGFKDADEYYRISSSQHYLQGIKVPTMLLHAENDPFLPAQRVPKQADLPANVQLEMARCGGHVGFVGGRFPGTLIFLPERIISYFRSQS